MKRLLALLCVVASATSALGKPAAVQRRPDGIVLEVGRVRVLVQVVAPNIIRVASARDPKFFERQSLAVLPHADTGAAWEFAETADEVVLTTAELKVHVGRADGRVEFRDRSDHPILAERAEGRSFVEAQVQGEKVLQVRQQWEPQEDEALYGLGQHQFGLMNLKGRDLDLWQRNTEIAVPVFVSSRGYGVIWDQTSRTRFGDLRDPEPLPADVLVDAEGKSGALTATYFADENFQRVVATGRSGPIMIAIPADVEDRNQRIQAQLPAGVPVSVRWTGSLRLSQSGEYTLWPFYNAGLKVWVDDQLVVDHWRQGWLPWYDQAPVRLEAGRPHKLQIDWVVDQNEPTLKFLWKTPSSETATSLWSEAAEGIDYNFVYGPSLDRVIAGYRTLTGRAPMMPVWALGLWQSRERYRTQQESLDVLAKYRELGAPLDVIVQDWFYWRAPEWGSHEFDEARFPDPAGWIKDIHNKYQARLLISVWPKFHEGTKNFEEMKSRGFLYQPNLAEKIKDWTGHRFTFYDAYNAEARTLFWAQMNRELFSKGADAWWLDASEPEMRHAPMLEEIRGSMDRTALGSASRVLLAFPLLNARGVFEGQRAAAPDQRVCILTRSGYTGLQRYGAAIWSGDITSTWTALRKQIPAGVSASLSGLPYWTTDSGGFAVPRRWSSNDGSESVAPTASLMSPQDAEEWAELNTRWLQFATFCPLMRIHGQFPFREIWQFGGTESPAYKAQLKMDHVRYRLLPYIYSLAGGVTHQGGTMMRGLVMDFPQDRHARELTDQFLFGPAFMVSPVTEYTQRSRDVYLPQVAGGWYDFWTGEQQDGGVTRAVAAPYDTIPVHVRAGSIVPTGPERQYTTEKPAHPVTLYVYAGADGAFTLYEDDGLTNAYEQGAFATIPLSWDDAARTLTVGKREGTFGGMLPRRTFRVVLVRSGKPVGFSFDPAVDRTLDYDGEPVAIRF